MIDRLPILKESDVALHSHYIEQAWAAEKRSHGLWQSVNQFVAVSLDEGRDEGRSLDEIAAILDEASGPEKKGEPVSLCNLRGAARQIRRREKDLVLL